MMTDTSIIINDAIYHSILYNEGLTIRCQFADLEIKI